LAVELVPVWAVVLVVVTVAALVVGLVVGLAAVWVVFEWVAVLVVE